MKYTIAEIIVRVRCRGEIMNILYNRRKSGSRGTCIPGRGLHGRSMLLAGVICIVSLMYSVLSATAAEDSAVAAVMQLMKTEGEVSVSNGSGRDITLIKNMRLYNGYSASTQEESYAWINMDSEKLAKLDAVSEAEVRKNGKKLEILLDSGNLFFNVTEDLEEDETLNIRTSTMVMGIRGTCGWVRVIDRWHSEVYLLEGEVSCSVTDPVTGQVKTTVLKSGQMAEFVVYFEEQAGDKCDIIIRGFSGEEIPGFVLVELDGNDPLCGKIRDASGIDVGSYTANAEARLKSDQEEMRQKMDRIRELLAKQDNHISKDPVWVRGNDTARLSTDESTGNQENSRGGNGAGSGPGRNPGAGPGTGTGPERGNAAPAEPADSSVNAGQTPNSPAGTGGGNNTPGSGTTQTPAADNPGTPTTPTTPAAPQTPSANNPGTPTTPSTPAASQPSVVTIPAPDLPSGETLYDITSAFNNGADQVILDGDLNVHSNLEIPEGKTLTVTGDLWVAQGPDSARPTLTVKGTLEVEGNLENENATIEVGTIDSTDSPPPAP